MVDYSKWKSIEVSDDEDDVHPNIDTGSLFRWRHQARVEKMEQKKQEEEQLKKRKAELKKKEEELKTLEAEAAARDRLEREKKKLELEKKKLVEDEQEFQKQLKLMPWNVDTISKEGWSKTVLNKTQPREDRSKLTEEELEQRYRDFVKKNEKLCKEYAMISKFEDCKVFLQQHQDLVCEESSNYLTMWCLNLEIEGKHDLMTYISRQVISLHYILELSKQMNIDPRGCVVAFFSRIQQAEKEYMDAYEDEVRSFQNRIQERAKVKIEEAMKEVEEEERQKRLGPGGLDPQEVFESLPESLQACFESRDIELLKKTLLEMDSEVAKEHMKRCIDSGLWLPDKNDQQEIDEATAGPSTPEPEYEAVAKKEDNQ